MLITGVGLGVALVCVAVSVLTGAREDETGMLSGLNTTGHEIGGSLGIAVLATIATGAIGACRAASAALASALGDAYLAAAIIAGAAAMLALVVLPSARSFLPRLRLAPSMPMH